MEIKSNEILTEISRNWKLEAKLENTDRYFFHTEEANQIINGNKFYVIGRKGSGKTAIGQYISNLPRTSNKNYNVFVEKLSFKNFPFNKLYSWEDKGYTAPNQYITIWKYVIYVCICRMMSKNENINEAARETLSKVFAQDPIDSLKKSAQDRVVTGGSIQLLGVGASIQVTYSPERDGQSWIDRTQVLEDIIREYIDEAEYYVIFDELDEDFRDFDSKQEARQYINLLTSLFKSVQDVKSVFRDKDTNGLKPIIFLRDDIYALVKDSDKNKWGDFSIYLDWDESKIKRMLAHRISNSISNNTIVLSFDEAWETIFSKRKIKYGTRQTRQTHMFKFITESTHIRPRDYIRYLQVCSEKAIEEQSNEITPEIVKRVDKAFSNYLKDEIVDEIYAQLPDITTILSIISQIRKQIFTIKEFKQHYDSYLKMGTIKERNVDKVLQTLFNFSVIGNRPRNRTVSFFRFNNSEARFNFNENIIVHRGLFKALQIL
ncbi:P-loop ATPase, Sll1717 family [Porphyromonas gingivalis]|uniref:P-loop ATPase, Sll1717 family n=1 Tax=Porphyromonas gingivalis TaxID=837 RepID=UPI000974FBA8|nr:hypothetical protein [Porphyromonas gingivalis]SJL27833.1 hypothetical protein PGIN_AFR-5B1_00498 [Porphyromonas gingivalis]